MGRKQPSLADMMKDEVIHADGSATVRLTLDESLYERICAAVAREGDTILAYGDVHKKRIPELITAALAVYLDRHGPEAESASTPAG